MQVLALNYNNETISTLNGFRSGHGLTYPILRDLNSGVFNLYSMGFVPHNTLLDTARKVIYTAAGYSQQIEDQIISLIDHYYQPAYANEVTLNHGFMQMGVDTLIITSQMENTGNHNVELYAMFNSLVTICTT